MQVSEKKFEKLLSPLDIGGVRLKNRMVKPPQGINFCAEDFTVNDRYLNFYEAMARGGLGMIIAGNTAVDYPLGFTKTRTVLTNDDKFLPGMTRLAKAIHKHDCKTFLQLGHAGPAMSSSYFGGIQPIAASSLEDYEQPQPSYDRARALTIPEIKELIGLFGNSADRAYKSGFDGVEVHSAHNYLLNTFLSLALNKRQDEYGCQNVENRTRFAVEIIQEIKKRLGQDFPVGIRINGGEWGIEKGITIEEAQESAQMFEKAGADYIHVSGYGVGLYNDIRIPEMMLYPEPVMPEAKLLKKPGMLVPGAEAVKKKVSVPVIAVGRLDPELGEWILGHNMADLISMGRRILADHDLPNKVASGHVEDIRPCVACLLCLHSIRIGEPARCRVNAALGKEAEYEIKPAKKKKKIMIIGAGPAGMEAARVASLRGHEVTLYDKDSKVGGLMTLAAMIKGTEVEDLPAFTRYLKIQLEKQGVTVKLGQEVSPALVEATKPDALIIAGGGVPTLPEIPGIDNRKVLKTEDLHRKVKGYLRLFGPSMLRWLTKFWMPIGKRVVIIGGQMQGSELTEFLIKRGRTVTLVETSAKLGEGISDQLMERLLAWLAKKDATIMTEVKYEEITDKGLTITTKEGKKQTLEADTILTAVALRPNTELVKAFEGKVPEIHVIGDCGEPLIIADAVDGGSRIGCTI